MDVFWFLVEAWVLLRVLELDGLAQPVLGYVYEGFCEFRWDVFPRLSF